MSHVHVRCDVFMCDMTLVCVRRDSFMCDALYDVAHLGVT